MSADRQTFNFLLFTFYFLLNNVSPVQTRIFNPADPSVAKPDAGQVAAQAQQQARCLRNRKCARF